MILLQTHTHVHSALPYSEDQLNTNLPVECSLALNPDFNNRNSILSFPIVKYKVQERTSSIGNPIYYACGGKHSVWKGSANELSQASYLYNTWTATRETFTEPRAALTNKSKHAGIVSPGATECYLLYLAVEVMWKSEVCFQHTQMFPNPHLVTQVLR